MSYPTAPMLLRVAGKSKQITFCLYVTQIYQTPRPTVNLIVLQRFVRGCWRIIVFSANILIACFAALNRLQRKPLWSVCELMTSPALQVIGSLIKRTISGTFYANVCIFVSADGCCLLSEFDCEMARSLKVNC